MLKFDLPYPPSKDNYEVLYEGNIVSFYIENTGYLRHKGKYGTFFLHQLVAFKYLGLKPEGYVVNHIDGDKLNNAPDNLEYITPGDNIKHGFKLGLINNSGSNNGRSKLTEKEVLEIRASKLNNKQLSKKYKISVPMIVNILTKRNWKHV